MSENIQGLMVAGAGILIGGAVAALSVRGETKEQVEKKEEVKQEVVSKIKKNRSKVNLLDAGGSKMKKVGSMNELTDK